MNNELVRNVIRNTHNGVKYVIWAKRQLTRDEMLKQIRHIMYDTSNIRPKRGSEIELDYNEDL